MSCFATQLHRLSPPYKVHPDHNRHRAPNGKFMPAVLRDNLGRRLIEVDLREVERRLKAREKKVEA